MNGLGQGSGLHFGSIAVGGSEHPAIDAAGRGVALVRHLLPGFDGDLVDIIGQGLGARIREAVAAADESAFLDPDSVEFRAPFRRCRMIWGIGLNYRDHAGDLNEQVPDEPASFIKGDHTIVGPNEPIILPQQSTRTTAEAELGLVIGRQCRDVDEGDALDYVFGVFPLLDQTAEDILQRNPRFLTRSKNFPTFFSFGPTIVPVREVVNENGDLSHLTVSTVLNGAVHRSNSVAHMRYSPQHLISFHSHVMPLLPGDVILTGTPGAVALHPGDVVESRIDGVGSISNPVIDQA